ncbi:MAG: hypothetical protein JNJ85_06695 [Candidatus Kapabacteria bacterium]|nr:hypothetical protein [Candidatus Kapabacteria bacterium]
MKKLLFVSLLVVTPIVVVFIHYKDFLISKEVALLFVSAHKHTFHDVTADGGLNYFDWFIISDESQRSYLEQCGYAIPHIDFSKNYLIISKYRITKLTYKQVCESCTGVPDGLATFDKENSQNDMYYFYIMPCIMLSQGVG